MNEQATAQFYGRMLGILSGLFGLLQVLVSVSSVLANQGAIDALQHSTSSPYLGTIPTDFSGVVTVLLVTYGSAILAGLIMIGFAWYAGRLTALSLDRRAGGGFAGFWVALWSGAIWLAVSLVGTVLTHADGTITGVFTSSQGRPLNVAQVVLLLVQNGIAALVGLGLGALAGLVGARSARVSANIQPRMPLGAVPGMYPQGVYPPAPYMPGMYPAGVYPGGMSPQGAYPQAAIPSPGAIPQRAVPQEATPQGAASPAGDPASAYPGAYAQEAYPTRPFVASRPDPMRYPAYSSSPSIPSPIAPPPPTQPLARPRGQSTYPLSPEPHQPTPGDSASSASPTGTEERVPPG